jgi:hypothetical protein
VSENRDSLERYLKTRGAQILGHSMNWAGLTLQATIGGLLLAFGIGLAIFAKLSGQGEIVPAGLGPILAGGINLSIALGIRRRISPETPVRAEMTRDAKALLLTLYREVAGWPSSPFGREHRGLRFRTRRVQRRLMMAGYGAPVPLPNEQVVALLEGAATAYNRISAAVAVNRDVPAIAKIATRVTLAADEAMAEVFHQAATLSRYPEGFDAGRGKIDTQVNALNEVATRLESLAASGSENHEKRLRSSVDDVLSELRLEQLARTELQQPVEDAKIRLEE